MNNTIPPYTKLPNSVLSWLCGPECNLNLRESKLLLSVFRYTYGFQTDHAMLSSRFLSEATGIDSSDVRKTMNALVEKGLLTVKRDRRISVYFLVKKAYKNKHNKHAGGGDLPPIDYPETCSEYDFYEQSPDDSYAGDGDLPPMPVGGELPPKSGVNYPLRNKKKKPITPSDLELAFRDLLVEADLCPFVEQYPFQRWRFDFAWPDQKIAVEVMGGLHIHGEHVSPDGYVRDCEKANTALLDGWLVLRVPSELMIAPETISGLSRALSVRGFVPDPDWKPSLPPKTSTGWSSDSDEFAGLI